MDEVKKIINQNEKVLWNGVPQLLPFIFSNILLVFFGLFFLLISLGFFGIFQATTGLFQEVLPQVNVTGDDLGFSKVFSSINFGMNIFFALFLVLPILFILNPLYMWALINKIHYVITDKRVIIKKGLIGTDFESIDYDKIQSMDIKVGVIDKIFGKNSGSIHIYSGRIESNGDRSYSAPHSLVGVTDPYSVFEQLKKISHDIKTDIEYPNDLRPTTNRGYNTGYNPEKY
jgi:hypothetical protein